MAMRVVARAICNCKNGRSVRSFSVAGTDKAAMEKEVTAVVKEFKKLRPDRIEVVWS
jgi:hypothetical protein